MQAPTDDLSRDSRLGQWDDHARTVEVRDDCLDGVARPLVNQSESAWAHPVDATCGASCDDEGAAAAPGFAEWLCLAATPTFAIMALLAGPLGGSRMEMLCLTGHGPALGGMVPILGSRWCASRRGNWRAFRLDVDTVQGLSPKRFDDALRLRHHVAHQLPGRLDIANQSYALASEKLH